MLGLGKIYPLDVFTLDIFVFNQSGWLRKLEVRCPGEQRHGKEERRKCDGQQIGEEDWVSWGLGYGYLGVVW